MGHHRIERVSHLVAHRRVHYCEVLPLDLKVLALDTERHVLDLNHELLVWLNLLTSSGVTVFFYLTKADNPNLKELDALILLKAFFGFNDLLNLVHLSALRNLFRIREYVRVYGIYVLGQQLP